MLGCSRARSEWDNASQRTASRRIITTTRDVESGSTFSLIAGAFRANSVLDEADQMLAACYPVIASGEETSKKN